MTKFNVENSFNTMTKFNVENSKIVIHYNFIIIIFKFFAIKI